MDIFAGGKLSDKTAIVMGSDGITAKLNIMALVDV
jgi:hypothetical protein